MNPQKQLFRQPIRTLVMLLLLCVASAFLCLGFGILRSSEATREAIEDQFVTVAFPVEGGHTSKNNGAQWSRGDNTPEYMRRLLSSCPAVKGTYHRYYVSAYSPELFPTTTMREGVGYSFSPNLNLPYNHAVLLVTITAIEEVEDEGYGPSRYITATVDQVIALHEDFTVRDTLRIYRHYFSIEERNGERLTLGQKYLIYGTDFSDSDLELRRYLAQICRCEIEEVDLSKIRYELTEVEREPEGIVAIYDDTEKGYQFYMPLYQNQIDAVNSNQITVQNWGADPSLCRDGRTYGSVVGGGITEEPLDVLLDMPTIQSPYIAKYKTVDRFLETPVGKEWTDVIEQVGITNHSVPVFGTDLLESMYAFHEKEAFVTRGRSFEEEEYENGSRVCLISETLATSSGLSLGDTIDLSFYWGPNYISDMSNMYLLTHGANLTACPYNKNYGFCAENMVFEIVGIYRQENIWEECTYDWGDNSQLRNNAYAFTPNTVFVPAKALDGIPTHTEESDVFVTLVLENGSIDDVVQFLADRGFSGNKLLFFDGGYSELVGTLDSFRESAGQLFLASVLTWLAAAVVYLALFVLRQRRNAGLMVSLGSGRRRAAGFVWTISMLPVLAASAVGALVGMALMNGTLEKVFASVQDVLSSDFSSTAGGHISVESTLVALPWTAALAALGQGLIFAALIWLCAAAITHRKPLDNLKGT